MVIKVRLSRMMDLTDPTFYESLGISGEALLDNPEMCLQIADVARQMGCEALLVPSATGVGTNLVIYQDRLAPGWVLEEVEREENVTLE